jgi:hypothetical protein
VSRGFSLLGLEHHNYDFVESNTKKADFTMELPLDLLGSQGQFLSKYGLSPIDSAVYYFPVR